MDSVADAGQAGLRAWLVAEHRDLVGRYQAQIGATVPASRWRDHVDGGGASVAWLRFHTALHADVALHCAIVGGSALVDRAALGIDGTAAHVGIGEADDPAVSEVIDLGALEDYCSTVDAAVGTWLAGADLTLQRPADLAAVEAAGITVDAVPWLHRLWGNGDIGTLVRWELLGHPLSHVGEMISLRSRMGLNPF